MSDYSLEFLSHVEPFSRLPVVELARLSLQIQPVYHEKGETIYNEGEDADWVWILKTGRVEIFKYNSDARPHAIELISPKQLYGTLCRIGGQVRNYTCTAVASAPSTSYRLADSTFHQLLERYPVMSTGACHLCSLRLNAMQMHLMQAQNPVEKRIAQTLINLHKTNGNQLQFTKREISELAATTVETTIRVMSRFEKKRWISSQRGQVTLKELHELESVAA